MTGEILMDALNLSAEDWERVTARLDAHAREIRALKKALRTMQEGAAASVMGSDRSIPPGAGESPGTFTPSPQCAMCGNDKGTRKTLTCATCSAERNRIIKSGGDRAPITRSSCFHCGATFAPSTRFLCTTCTPLFKIWKAGLK